MHKISLTAIIFFLLFITSGAFVRAATQVKTLDFYAYDSDTAISSSTTQDFTISIGDAVTGIPTPVKSAQFTVRGVYTGGGTLELTIDSANSETFTLPSVGSATPFSLLYEDTASIIAPTATGDYTYTLGITPSGVTLYGFSATLDLTHEFQPPPCPDGPPENEKVKSANFYIYDSETAVSTIQSTDFSIYIGDDISGITDPIKSALFTITGVYTGSGTVRLTVDGSSAQTFTLPPVSAAATPFSLLFEDTENIMSPTTAGTYTYTFALLPTTVTLYGLSATLTLTYQHKPPTCQAYPIVGELTSAVFDTTGMAAGAAYNSILWNGSFQSGTGKVRFQLATSGSPTGPWNYIGGGTCTNADWYDPGFPDTPVEITCAPTHHNNDRYFRYKVQLCSANDCIATGYNTPRIDEVVVNWSP